ncbi:MAG: FecR domain-containing protein [Devosia sp.]|nr:FecR domain-containing protein [Devosia sp.]
MAVAALQDCAASPAAAAGVHGTVIALAGAQWEELGRGDAVSGGQPARTPQSGRAELRRGDASIGLGPNTALRIDGGADGSSTKVTQYSGAAAVRAAGRQRAYLTIETPILVVVTSGGAVSVALDGEAVRVQVDSGKTGGNGNGGGAEE